MADKGKEKWRYLQKYWHKGAYFQENTDDVRGTTGIDSIFTRDFSGPTGEDKFDKTLMPAVMQVGMGGVGSAWVGECVRVRVCVVCGCLTGWDWLVAYVWYIMYHTYVLCTCSFSLEPQHNCTCVDSKQGWDRASESGRKPARQVREHTFLARADFEDLMSFSWCTAQSSCTCHINVCAMRKSTCTAVCAASSGYSSLPKI